MIQTFRLGKVSSVGSTTTFLYGGQDMIAEYSGTTVTKRYDPYGQPQGRNTGWFQYKG